MPDLTYHLHGRQVLECAPEGARPRLERDAADLVNQAWNHRANLLVIPACRLGDEFFRLKTGIAGVILQKFVTYKLQVAIVGDISRYLSESSALRDFVSETNRGTQVWFVPDKEELDRKLRSSRPIDA